MSNEEIEQEKLKLREEFEGQIKEIKTQYEEEKMSKEALMKKIESIKSQYDSQLVLLNDSTPEPTLKASSGRKSGKMTKKTNLLKQATANLLAEPTESTMDMSDMPQEDAAQRLLQLEQMVVGGEQANNEDLKKKRIKKKKYAEERKQLLAESLRNGDDEEFMLRVYDSVQEEAKYKTKLYEKEKERCKFLENECKDLQHEFEKDREDLLDTIRKNEKQIKLIAKILQKVQPVIPYDSNYHNLDRIQQVAIWNEEIQDWILPEFKREKLSLPAMATELNDFEIQNFENYDSAQYQLIVPQQQQVLLNSRRAAQDFLPSREPEVDRYRLKLENSQFNGSNYFKNKRQSELLGQTQDMKVSNGTLSPLSDNSNASSANSRGNRRY